MPTILSFLSGRQITNDSGVPQAGAKVFHYRATTTTNLTVWQDSGATVPHAQPVVTDAGGFVPLIYVDDTFNWKIVVTTAADVILPQYNFDNLEAAEPASPAATYSFAKFPWEQVSAASSPVVLTAADAGKAYEADTTGGNVEFDLPPAGDVPNGTGFVFKKTVVANSMIIDPNGAETIDGSATSLTIATENAVAGIYSNVAEWYRVNGYRDPAPLGALLPGLQSIQTFTASGTWTKPDGIATILTIGTGPGGGGGTHVTANRQGGGGGSGATCIELIDVTAIASETVTVGTGGAGGVAGGNAGGNGSGATTFGAHWSAGAGNGAAAGNGAGGAAGTASGANVNISGGVGDQTDNAGGTSTSGRGAPSFWGGGGGAVGNGNVAGNNGLSPGSGGSGATGTVNVGGAGANGIVVVLEFGS
jgi:hypothetical protein